eukprot:TRINITY_DN163_c0_g2_i2.p1 TRINITY_DN163_c0_g2~~TRINITY_DN163_c0_g2_i2.p1  ORF type:complete len:957 (+),score=386.03 TRINITY_DN163_c0_g2_i2:36-2906(+)
MQSDAPLLPGDAQATTTQPENRGVEQFERQPTDGGSDVMASPPEKAHLSGLWRSEPMELRSMNIERSVLEQVVRGFGELGCVQFRDLNTSAGWNEAPTEEEIAAAKHRRQFVSQIRTCEAIDRRLRYFDEKITEYNVRCDRSIEPAGPLGLSEFAGTSRVEDLPDILETLNTKLASEEKTIQEQSSQFIKNESEHQRFIVLRSVVAWAEQSAADTGVNVSQSDMAEDRDDRGLLVDMQQEQGTLGQIIGRIACDKFDTFQRLIYRVSKGNAVVMREELCGAIVFRIIYSSYEMQTRIMKLCLSVGADVYLGRFLQSYTGTSAVWAGVEALPQTSQEFISLKANIERNVQDCQKVIDSTKGLLFTTLKELARVQTERRHFVLKEKGIYHTLNMMQIEPGASFANAVGWIPKRKIPVVTDLLGQYDMCHLGAVDLSSDGKESPPTHYETNDFTATFQGIVDSYGIPRYQEANPAPFTIITFPWLFGVMYGDIGHGIIITVAAAIMIAMQKSLKKQALNEIVDMVFGARWLILLMGLFATYVGFLYNDAFGMMLDYSESRWLFPEGWTEAQTIARQNLENPDGKCYFGGAIPLVCTPCHMNDLVMIGLEGQQRCTCPGDLAFFTGAASESEYFCPVFVGNENVTYPNTMTTSHGPTAFGMDSAWHESDNKLTFFNGFKMKNAVILGVLQMTLGIVISLFNHLYFKNYEKIWFGFIPEVLFLFCSFGYMCLMLIMKWVSPWQNTNTAPTVLATMTNFFLSPGSYEEFDPAKCYGPEKECSGQQVLYAGQPHMQVILVLICVIAVPLMLIPIPLIARRRKKALDAEGKDSSHIDMQEVTIRQVIHVIEYVLGCVSNTASYLRLWALSLAHAELSDVFWKFTIMMGVEMKMSGFAHGIVMYGMWGAWFTVTVGVLIMMEALSAFLHALRLHWVEFQNKFYVGDGTKFTPLCFETIIEEAEEK